MTNQSSPDVLFTITKENLETGLRGYPVGYCTTSSVDANQGLFFSGYNVKELVEWEPEKVIYLLYYGKTGNDQQIKDFKAELKKRAFLKPEVITHIAKLPRSGHSMKLFCAATLILGMFEETNDWHEDCLNLIAKIPLLVALVINHHAGWGRTPEPNHALGYIENFTHMLNVPNSNKDELLRAFKLFNILHYDHGGGNLSTFVGKAVASGLEDMYGSICSAMCALAGPKHGRANQDCLEFVKEVLGEVGANATADDIAKLLKHRLETNQLIYGFGHAVLRVEDPRAIIFYETAKKYYPDNSLVKIALLLREEGQAILKQNPKISDPYPNVDAISGTVLAAAGFNYPQYFTALFGLSRTVGIARQIVYERTEAREGKGTPIVRPKYIYKGPATSKAIP